MEGHDSYKPQPVNQSTGVRTSTLWKPPAIFSLLVLATILTFPFLLPSCADEGSQENGRTTENAPSAPTNVAASPGDTQITLSWDPVTGADSYNLYWGTSSGITKTTGTQITGVITPHVHNGLTSGTAYYYVVTAVKAGGESPESVEVNATPQVPDPSAPTGVAASPGDTQVTVSWDPVSGADSYNLYWSPTSGVTKGTGTQIAGVTTPHVHNGLTNGTAYYYVVTAVNVGEESAESVEVNATPQVSAPTNVAASPGDTQVTISWDPGTGADSYNLYWATTSGVTKGTGTQIAGITATSYTHASLTNGTPYYYVVTAVNAGGESAKSVEVTGIPQVVWIALAAGGWHTVAVRADGTLWAWGWNRDGQLGSGDTMGRTTPSQLGTASDWATVAASGFHTLALKNNGTLWAWGANNWGQLGLGTTSGPEMCPIGSSSFACSTRPVQVGTDVDWYAVSVGGASSLALKTNGTLWGWGFNQDGQLGLGFWSSTPQSTPMRVSTAGDWATVAAGSVHTAALKTDGTLWAWGANWAGQLGTSTIENCRLGLPCSTTPLQIGTAVDWAILTVGGNRTLAGKTDNTLWAWGENDHGQLGLGDTDNRNTPTQVGMAGDWATVAAGGWHTVAVSTDGTLWAWGRNNHGQLGSGDTVDRYSPTELRTTGVWAAARAGSYYLTLGLNVDGTLWAWGDNFNGQLGLGDTTDRWEPTRVVVP